MQRPSDTPRPIPDWALQVSAPTKTRFARAEKTLAGAGRILTDPVGRSAWGLAREDGDNVDTGLGVRNGARALQDRGDGVRNRPNDAQSGLRLVANRPGLVRNRVIEVGNAADLVRNEVIDVRNQPRLVPNQPTEVGNQADAVRNQAIEVQNELIDVANGVIEVPNEARLVPNQPIEVRNEVDEVPNQAIDVRNEVGGVRNEAGAEAAGAEGVDLQRPDDRGIVLTINSQWLTAQGEREQGRANPRSPLAPPKAGKPPGEPRWRGWQRWAVNGGCGSPGTVRPTVDAQQAKQNPGACGWLRGLEL